MHNNANWIFPWERAAMERKHSTQDVNIRRCYLVQLPQKIPHSTISDADCVMIINKIVAARSIIEFHFIQRRTLRMKSNKWLINKVKWWRFSLYIINIKRPSRRLRLWCNKIARHTRQSIINELFIIIQKTTAYIAYIKIGALMFCHSYSLFSRLLTCLVSTILSCSLIKQQLINSFSNHVTSL